MDNVISLREQKQKKANLQGDFQTVLEKPLNLDLQTKTEAKSKKAGLLKRCYWKCRWKVQSVLKHAFETCILPIRNYIYRKRTGQLMGELMSLVAKLNRDDFHIMVHFYGNASRIDVTVHLGGFSGKDTEPKGSKVRVLCGSLPATRNYSKMKPSDIRHAMTLLKTLSKMKKDNY